MKTLFEFFTELPTDIVVRQLKGLDLTGRLKKTICKKLDVEDDPRIGSIIWESDTLLVHFIHKEFNVKLRFFIDSGSIERTAQVELYRGNKGSAYSIFYTGFSGFRSDSEMSLPLKETFDKIVRWKFNQIAEIEHVYKLISSYKFNEKLREKTINSRSYVEHSSSYYKFPGLYGLYCILKKSGIEATDEAYLNFVANVINMREQYDKLPRSIKDIVNRSGDSLFEEIGHINFSDPDVQRLLTTEVDFRKYHEACETLKYMVDSIRESLADEHGLDKKYIVPDLFDKDGRIVNYKKTKIIKSFYEKKD